MNDRAPDPYAALKRVVEQKPVVQKSLLRLLVWCEQGKCTPIRVFETREGMLVQCRSDANVRHLRGQIEHDRDWSKRRAFFLESVPGISGDGQDVPGLQVVCECSQTTPRPVDLRKLMALVPDTPRQRNVKFSQVVTTMP